MYEYEIMNKETNERCFIWGYNDKDAFRRTPSLNPNEWTIIDWEYID